MSPSDLWMQPLGRRPEVCSIISKLAFREGSLKRQRLKQSISDRKQTEEFKKGPV